MSKITEGSDINIFCTLEEYLDSINRETLKSQSDLDVYNLMSWLSKKFPKLKFMNKPEGSYNKSYITAKRFDFRTLEEIVEFLSEQSKSNELFLYLILHKLPFILFNDPYTFEQLEIPKVYDNNGFLLRLGILPNDSV